MNIDFEENVQTLSKLSGCIKTCFGENTRGGGGIKNA
jgi:hypothetical protein